MNWPDVKLQRSWYSEGFSTRITIVFFWSIFMSCFYMILQISWLSEILCSCNFSLSFFPKTREHTLQWNFFSSPWTVLKCWFLRSLVLKHFSQISHLKLLWCKICVSESIFCENIIWKVTIYKLLLTEQNEFGLFSWMVTINIGSLYNFHGNFYSDYLFWNSMQFSNFNKIVLTY